MKGQTKKIKNLSSEKLILNQDPISDLEKGFSAGEVKKDNKKIKMVTERGFKLKLGLAIVTFLLGNLSWFFSLLLFKEEINYQFAFFVIILLMAFVVSICLLIFMAKRNLYLIITFVLSNLFIFFIAYEHFLMAVIFMIFSSIIFLLGVLRIKFEQHSRIKVSAYFFLRRGIALITLSVSLLVATVIYFEVTEKDFFRKLKIQRVSFSEKVTYWGIDVAYKISSNKELKWILEELSVEDYLRKAFFKEKESLNLSDSDQEKDSQEKLFLRSAVIENLNFLSEKERQELLMGVDLAESLEAQELIIDKVIEDFSYQVGRRIDREERMIGVVHELFLNRLNQVISMRTEVLQAIPVGFSFAVFLLLEFIFWAFRLPMVWTTSGVFSILVKLKLIEIRKELKNVETLE